MGAVSVERTADPDADTNKIHKKKKKQNTKNEEEEIQANAAYISFFFLHFSLLL